MNNIDERTGKPKIILHLCAKMGSDSQSYADMGYDRRIIGEEIGVENYNPPDNVYGIIANPPCTHFSIARTCAKTPRDLREGLRLVKECLRIIWECQYKTKGDQRTSPLKFWVIENPGTGFLKWFLGKPCFEYSPHEYGGTFTKRTALWGTFNHPHRPLLYTPLPSNRSLGGHYIGNEKLAFTHDGGGKAMCNPQFAKEFFIANQ